jgi:membrane protein DedA with SNARE-associated domain
MDLQRFIVDHGTWSYFITFVWTFFEGETFVLIAGFAAAQGLLIAPLLLVAAWLGSFAGDQCYFWIGRHFGMRLVARNPHWRERVDRALSWLTRFDTGFILSFRFIYGVRNFSSFALGISSIGWRRFMLLNFIAAGLWATVFVGVGLLCGHAFVRMVGQLAHGFSVVLLVVFIAALVAGHLFHKMRRNRRRRSAEAALTRG